MKLPSAVIILLIPSFALTREYEIRTPLALTKYGPVKGITENSSNGRPYESYRGIPYAKPPVGALRFKAPEPPKEWIFPIDAQKDGPFCIQKNYLFGSTKVEGQEDCLYINVYTPWWSTSQEHLLPIMVFIHWGGFFAGRGTSDYLSPEYFMDKDVVLVTFNYRLGVLGFLSTLDDEAPGNFALKDQVAALRWVQSNIQNFGGDKNKVTIFGQSAGAGSVHLHMLSPLSRGLFHAAISQSGSALALWATPINNLQSEILAAQATFVNCSSYIGNSYEIVKCLRDVPAEVLVQSQDLFKTFSVDPLTVYSVVVEEETDANPEPFITKYPIEYINGAEFNDVPWIIGTVEDEGLLKVPFILRHSSVREKFNRDFDTILPGLMYFSLSTPDAQSLQDNVTKFYLEDRHYVNTSDPYSIQGFINLYSDRAFVYSSYQSALLHGALASKPVWFYNFNYKGEYSYEDYFSGTSETINFNWGVSHCDDLLYLFASPGLFPPLRQPDDLLMKNVMINLWTNFAIYRNPNPVENRVLPLTWDSLRINGRDDMKNENLCYLNIRGSCGNGIFLNTPCGYKSERMNFWIQQHVLENIPDMK